MPSADVTAALFSLADAYTAATADADERQSDYQTALSEGDGPSITTAQIRRDQSRALLRGIRRAQDAAGALT